MYFCNVMNKSLEKMIRNHSIQKCIKVIVLALFTIHCSLSTIEAQTLLSQYRPGLTAEGAVYALPKTALRISVLVEKTTFEPGDFAPYAQRYLRVADAGQEASTSFRVVDVMLTPMPVADSTKIFAVKFDPRTVASRLSLSDDGRLLGLNIDDATDVELPSPFIPQPSPITPNPRQYMSEEILSCGSTAKMAELTAHEIYDLRENRTLLIKGQADFMPQDGRQMQIMLDQLDQQDRALTSLFLGTTRRDTTEHILWYEPTQSLLTKTVLFRLSQLHGLVEADDLSGAPYYISIEDITQLPAPEAQDHSTKLLGLFKNKQASSQQQKGIYVNVPGRLRATIYEGINTIVSGECLAPQFGHTLLLSGSLFNKRYTTRLRLNPLTGAIDHLDADPSK
jgi:hypothetical protein